MRQPRVLFVDPYPRAYCETYISSEAAWLKKNGVNIASWSRGERVTPGVDDDRILGSLAEACAAFNPDILHLYAHLRPAEVVSFVRAELLPTGRPFTIRGHGYGFDTETIPELHEAARIWLFPHHAAALGAQDNVEVLPVSYDPTLYFPPDTRNPVVVRAGAARAGKGLEGFLRVAALCPSVAFVLIVTGADSDYLYGLAHQATANVTVHMHLPAAKAAEIVRHARVCLRGHDLNSHSFGMPISLAEAMGAGLPVVVRAADPASPSRFGPEEYVSDAGFLYRTEEEAAEIVERVMHWSVAERADAEQRALARARLYRADVVLPRMVEVWRELI